MSPWRTGAIVLLLLTTGCSISGEEEPLPDVKREQAVATAGPRQLTDTGPAPGVLREVWRVDGLGRDAAARQVRVAGGQLFIAGKDGLDVHDAGTGEKRWHYREPGRELSGYAVIGDDLALVTRTDLDVRLTGLDAGTGALRWERAGGEARPSTDSQHLRLAMGEGVVPVVIKAERPSRGEEAEPDQFVALDAVTGEERWRRAHRPPSGCDSALQKAVTDTDGSVVVFSEFCRKTRFFYAFDPADGKPLWSRTGTSGTVVQASVREGATLIELDENTRTVVGRDDREISGLNGTGRCTPTCTLRKVGDELGLLHHDRVRHVLSLIDPSGGQVRTVAAPGDIHTAATGGRLYGISATLQGLLPARVDLVDPATDQVTTMPLPLNLKEDRARWAGTAGDQLLVATARKGSLIAYASTPVQGPMELSGVPKEDWPEACDLLKDLPGKTTERTPTVAGLVMIGTQELARSGCRATYSVAGQDRRARAEMLWVSADAAGADALVDGEPGLHGADEVEKLSAERVRLRQGRFVFEVTAEPSGDLERIATGAVRALS